MMRWWQSTAMLRLTGLVMCVATLLCGQAARRTFTFERDVQTSSVWSEIPRWDGTMLVGWDHNDSASPIIYTIDQDGRRDEILFTFQGAAQIGINHATGSQEGEIAIVGSAYTADGRFTSFLARISADRRRQTITRTSPYHPSELTFAPDGTVWTVGNLKDEENTRDVVPKHLLRRFDSAGKLLGSAVIRVKGFHPDESTFLRASRDRVAWFTGEEYIEFGLDGSEADRYYGPEVANVREITGVAVSGEGDVVVGRFGGGAAGVLVLDRETRTWDAATLPSQHAPTWTWILGFDGATLVTYSDVGILRRFKMK
jgi:hypothetical protein